MNQVEASTPVVPTNKHLTRITKEIAVTPLRRLSRQNISAVPDTVEKTNDDEERQRRRSQVVIQKRLSNIPSYNSVLNESISEKDANTYAQTCIKLFAENKINTQVAWGLKIIDYLSKLSDSLALAGTSLHVSASVYGLKVDDTHAAGMNLASAVMSARAKEAQEENDDGEGGEGADDDDENGENQGRKNKKAKKQKRLLAGQNAAIAKDPDSLLSPIHKVDTTFFQTQSRADLSTIDNLFTTRFPRDASGWKFSYNFDENEKAWITPEDPDPIVDDDGADELFPFEMPPLKNFKLCPAFDDFDLAQWNPDEEDKLLNDSMRSFKPNEKPLCFEDGVPIPELDGSIHDIFENGADDAGGGDDYGGIDENLEEEEIAAGFQGNVEHIVNFKPYDSNPRESLICAQNVEQIWAGPSHWKCKFVRPSVARYTGSLINTAQTEQQKQKRKKKEKIASTSLDFYAERKENETKKLKKTKKKSVCDPQLLTLPLPFFNIEPTGALLNKPSVILQKKKSESQEDCEVAPYNYDNPNDSLYCSQNGGDAPSLNDDNGDIAGNDDVQFEENFAENLVQAPQSVPKSYIQYTKQAKRMNMKKLKNAVWACLTDGKPADAENDKVKPVREQHFSDIYRILPQHLSDKMKKDLSCPLAFAALLHLCNEHDLELVGQPDLKDVFIRPMQDV